MMNLKSVETAESDVDVAVSYEIAGNVVDIKCAMCHQFVARMKVCSHEHQ